MTKKIFLKLMIDDELISMVKLLGDSDRDVRKAVEIFRKTFSRS